MQAVAYNGACTVFGVSELNFLGHHVLTLEKLEIFCKSSTVHQRLKSMIR